MPSSKQCSDQHETACSPGLAAHTPGCAPSDSVSLVTRTGSCSVWPGRHCPLLEGGVPQVSGMLQEPHFLESTLWSPSREPQAEELGSPFFLSQLPCDLGCVCTCVSVEGGEGERQNQRRLERLERQTDGQEASFFTATLTSPRPMPSALQPTVPAASPFLCPLSEHHPMSASGPYVPTSHPGLTTATTAPH